MVLRLLLLGLFGLSGGVATSAGVFALITSTGVMTRLADKTHTARAIKVYEDSVVWGGILSNIFFVCNISFIIPHTAAVILIVIFGLFSGMFVGCLATSLAETLNTTAIFTRRAGLKNGLGIIVLMLAVGKAVGAGLQFFWDWVI